MFRVFSVFRVMLYICIGWLSGALGNCRSKLCSFWRIATLIAHIAHIADPNPRSTFTMHFVICDISFAILHSQTDTKFADNATIEGQSEGILYSANYPSTYFNDLFYTITIKTYIDNPAIIVWFDTIDIEWQKNCLYDYLMLRDSRRQKRICGQINDKELVNKVFISQTNEMSITFKSDFSNRGSGFKLNWKAFTMGWCDSKQTVIDESENRTESDVSHIDSPGYPTWNLPNLNCSLVIVAKGHKRVSLRWLFTLHSLSH